jgi:hypothetical protein
MKQGLNALNSLVPGSNYYSKNSKSSFSTYLLFFMAAFFLLFISGYKKNEPRHSCLKCDMVGNMSSQGSKIRWIPYKGSFKAMDEMTQVGKDAEAIQKDQLIGMDDERSISRYSIEIIERDISRHFPGNFTYKTFTAANGDEIFETGYGFIQVKKHTKFFIYLL